MLELDEERLVLAEVEARRLLLGSRRLGRVNLGELHSLAKEERESTRWAPEVTGAQSVDGAGVEERCARGGESSCLVPDVGPLNLSRELLALPATRKENGTQVYLR